MPSCRLRLKPCCTCLSARKEWHTSLGKQPFRLQNRWGICWEKLGGKNDRLFKAFEGPSRDQTPFPIPFLCWFRNQGRFFTGVNHVRPGKKKWFDLYGRFKDQAQGTFSVHVSQCTRVREYLRNYTNSNISHAKGNVNLSVHCTQNHTFCPISDRELQGTECKFLRTRKTNHLWVWSPVIYTQNQCY